MPKIENPKYERESQLSVTATRDSPTTNGVASDIVCNPSDKPDTDACGVTSAHVYLYYTAYEYSLFPDDCVRASCMNTSITSSRVQLRDRIIHEASSSTSLAKPRALVLRHHHFLPVFKNIDTIKIDGLWWTGRILKVNDARGANLFKVTREVVEVDTGPSHTAGWRIRADF
ncbi:hypothetical protein EVAR_46476_1 [Eumeta japonica]|uniref:Uncharacterized protein n=1 Tax=Eumeta variegata TaxID=151549 RepID=A0A4C1XK39_EUMVA|nr:hypothetical protein EVAR_46476_1 [Eumeta japonica]